MCKCLTLKVVMFYYRSRLYQNNWLSEPMACRDIGLYSNISFLKVCQCNLELRKKELAKQSKKSNCVAEKKSIVKYHR